MSISPRIIPTCRCVIWFISQGSLKNTHGMIRYSSALVKIPVPRFVVFYNGTDVQPDRQTLRLSDAFEKKTAEPELELKVIMLNINFGHNKELMDKSRTLREYAQYVDRVRKYAKLMRIEEAVERAVAECIKEGILEDFLSSQKAEVIAVSIFEYNEEEEMKKIRASEYREGKADGKAEGKAEIVAIIRKKTGRGLDSEKIAEILEMDPDYVKRISDLLVEDPDRSDLQVAEILVGQKEPQ